MQVRSLLIRGRDDIECLDPGSIRKAFQAHQSFGFASLCDECGIKFLDDLFRLAAITAALEK
jgi:hypothetical protein